MEQRPGKTCPTCNQFKPFFDPETEKPNFHRNKNAADGWSRECRECKNQASRERYDKDKEVERVKQWREQNPERRNAAEKVYRQRRRQRDREARVEQARKEGKPVRKWGEPAAHDDADVPKSPRNK